jgi:hypothetical protein
MDNFSPNLFSEYPNIADVFKVIYAVGIAYNFDLTMTEENDIGTTIDALGGWAPKFTLGFSADADRGRKNERSFTITDTFKGLMTQLGHPSPEGIRYCDNHIVEANYVYPIAGHIGVITLVKTFLNLVVFDDLAAGKDKATPGSAGGPPSIADQLTFTTTIDASLSPKITFSPVGHTLEMSDVGFTGKVSRIPSGHGRTCGGIFSGRRSYCTPQLCFRNGRAADDGGRQGSCTRRWQNHPRKYTDGPCQHER